MSPYYAGNGRLLRFLPLLIPIAAILLYSPFLQSPLVFDDQYFFFSGRPEQFVAEGFRFQPRWLALYSHAATYVFVGPELIWQRIPNMLFHGGTGWALYALLSRLLRDLGIQQERACAGAVAAALIFVLHPASVFAAAYLIQRTSLMGTLFSVLSWLALWVGLSGRRAALWSAPPLFLLAILSKEHFVLAPAVACALIVLHHRSGLAMQARISELSIVLALQGAIAAWAILSKAQLLGASYETGAGAALAQAASAALPTHAHALSVLSQCGLFFKYLLLWLLPNQAGMSADMREVFTSLPLTAGDVLPVVLFCAYGAAAAILLFKGRVAGLIGWALLAPWLLFFTEFAAVRIQEMFVLYRSYFWMAPLMLLVAFGFSRLSRDLGSALVVVLGGACAAMAWVQLENFSSNFQLWDNAARLVEKRGNAHRVTGLERIYRNRGLAYSEALMFREALQDFDRALHYRPDFAHAYQDRGATYLQLGMNKEALADFDTAIRLKPDLGRAYAGRAIALENLHHPDAADAHRDACRSGWQPSCASPLIRPSPSTARP